MARMSNIDKLKAISTPAEEDWLKIAEEWEREDVYLEKSTRIAVTVLSILRERKMTKQDLAEKMGVSAQYVSKIVKGNENLTLETITKLEKALGVELISVTDPTYVFSTEGISSYRESIWDRLFSAKFSAKSNESIYQPNTYLQYQDISRLGVAIS